MRPYTRLQDTALLILRVIVAAIFIQAAYAKISFWSSTPEGMSTAMANLVRLLSIVEPLGALAVFAGFRTRWAAGGLAIIMVGAIYVMQFTMNIGFATPTGPGWSFPLSVLASCGILMAFGAGSWSVDSKR